MFSNNQNEILTALGQAEAVLNQSPVLLARRVEMAIRNPWDIPRLPIRRRHIDAQAIRKTELLCQKFHVRVIAGLVALVPGFAIRQKLGECRSSSRGHLLTRRLPFRPIG